jgi:RNA polymerase sigma-70 factor (ECF subfamily)
LKLADLENLSDEELVKLAQCGSREAFTTLYDRYLPVVYRRVRYTIPEADVEDTTQEIFIMVLNSLPGFRGDALFRTWLRTLTNRGVANYYRQRSPEDFQQKDETEDDSDETGAAFMNSHTQSFTLAVDDALVMRQALARLPAKYREVLFLRLAEDRPFNEVAQQLGQSLEATKSLFRRAVDALQKILEVAHV